MNYQELQNDFLQLENKSIDELNDLLQKYSKLITKGQMDKQLRTNFTDAIKIRNAKKKIESVTNKNQSQKIYYELNKQRLNAQMSLNYQKQKEIHKEKIVCDICNGCYTYTNKSHHNKSIKHKNALEEN
jgi:hypothetical protein